MVREHIKHVEEVLVVLKEANLQLNPPKCSLFKREMDYLDHTVTGEGLKPLKENIEAITNMPQPKTAKQTLAVFKNCRREFSVETDHCPLCNFHKKPSKNGRVDRWSLELAEYDITEIKYKKGKCHCGPDLLSRYMKIELFDQENDARLLKQSNDSQQQQDVQEIQQQCNVITRARVNNTAQSATRHAPVAVNRNSS
ncbi:unnamed protein product [Didymodactylos carnosus]|uniref:Reverse transcriptase domain-containing protein n=1 Tax=Didymodactylos carnosus TaxID=1234261 RepID=A0A8S2UDU8_9BILA|nr:unnamed protein product [Didymodactylos carnosus]CAF4330349.1 unnamed protein product [Didymodactylos carnosus]